MDATSNFLGRKLLERLREKEAVLQPILLAGRAQDFADYKQRAGYLEGLRDAIRWIEEISLEDERRPNARNA
jgi:hypothetical protein